jgi:hypothetical protein
MLCLVLLARLLREHCIYIVVTRPRGRVLYSDCSVYSVYNVYSLTRGRVPLQVYCVQCIYVVQTLGMFMY